MVRRCPRGRRCEGRPPLPSSFLPYLYLTLPFYRYFLSLVLGIHYPNPRGMRGTRPHAREGIAISPNKQREKTEVVALSQPPRDEGNKVACEGIAISPIITTRKDLEVSHVHVVWNFCFCLRRT